MKRPTVWQGIYLLCVIVALSCMPARASIATNDAPAAEAKPIALVIGNGDYRNDAALGNPVNDARAMSAMLRALGFDVIAYENATREQMRQAAREFGARLAAGGTGLFYFAGHGFAQPGKTLLMPVDVSSHVMPEDAVELQSVLDSMAAPRPQQRNIVLLDICLNNPFGALPADAAVTSALGAQTLVAYATTPGAFAADGATHGIFTGALLRAMSEPGRDLEHMLQRVGAAVREATGGRQVPQVVSSLTAPFRFLAQSDENRALLSQLAPPAESVRAYDSRAIMPKDSEEQYELSFWESIKDSNHASDYEAYLKTYPNGRFAALARARIARLRATEQKSETPPAAKSAPEKAPAEKPRPAPAAKAQPPAPKPEPEQARPAPTPAPVTPPQQAEKAGPRPGGVSEIQDCPACPVLVSLPRGAFTMGTNAGDPSEKPPHHVTISKPFAIGKHEVTVEQWDACVNAGGCPRVPSSAGAPKHNPMRDVSWDDAQQYAQWLSKTTGKQYRLPTEAEWEYAARGGTTTRYWWGDQMRQKMANCKECGEPWRKDSPADVGSFAPNPYGIYDMNGSVWEWVEDCWHSNYTGAPNDGRAWEQPNCRVRVIRGGSWLEGGSYMLVSTRFKYDAAVRQSQNGFRVARGVE